MPVPDFVPWEPCPNQLEGGPTIDPVAVVVHDTIGSWPGDKNYVQRNSLAHCTIGPDDGNWAFHADTHLFLPHCNGANRKAWGVEFSNWEPGAELTSWSRWAWGQLIGWAHDVENIPAQYLDPESVPNATVWVNGGGYTGWISHRSVRTDDGSYQHTDFRQAADWRLAVASISGTQVPTRGDGMFVRWSLRDDISGSGDEIGLGYSLDGVILEQLLAGLDTREPDLQANIRASEWQRRLAAQDGNLIADLVAARVGSPGGGITVAQVDEIVQARVDAAINATRLIRS